MALKVFVIDDALGTCDLREMVPYTNVTSNDGTVVITGTTDPVTGQPIYDLSAAVDVNVNNFSYNAATKEITLTETDGDTYTIDVSDLVDAETVTTFVDNGNGTYTYTSEDGTVTTTAAAVGETVTTFVANVDGSYTYTSENGTVTTIPAVSALIEDTTPPCDFGVEKFNIGTGLTTGEFVRNRTVNSKMHLLSAFTVVQVWAQPASPAGTPSITINENVDLASFIPAGVDPSCISHAIVSVRSNVSYEQNFATGQIVPQVAVNLRAGTANSSSSANTSAASGVQGPQSPGIGSHSSISNNSFDTGFAELTGTSVSVTGAINNDAGRPTAAANNILQLHGFMEA